MELRTIWQQGDPSPENQNNLEKICQWWFSLDGKKINWIQRMIPQSGSITEIHWTPQRFDESFILVKPEFAEDTLYWHIGDSEIKHNTMVAKLELDQLHQHFYIYPQTQTEVIIRIELAEIEYQTLNLNHPQVLLSPNQTLTFRDPQQHLEVQISLTPQTWEQLKQYLGG